MTDVILGFASLGVIVLSARFWIRALKRVEIPEKRRSDPNFVLAALREHLDGAHDGSSAAVSSLQ